jgi:hypothetical protein
VNAVTNLLTLEGVQFVELRLKTRPLRPKKAKWYVGISHKTDIPSSFIQASCRELAMRAGDGLFESHKGCGLS